MRNDDCKFIFKWVKAHTDKTDNDSVGNARADRLAKLGSKVGFDSGEETNHIVINDTNIHINHVADFCG